MWLDPAVQIVLVKPSISPCLGFPEDWLNFMYPYGDKMASQSSPEGIMSSCQIFQTEVPCLIMAGLHWVSDWPGLGQVPFLEMRVEFLLSEIRSKGGGSFQRKTGVRLPEGAGYQVAK